MEFSPQQMQAYRETFAQFDINNDGTISAGELVIVMKELGLKTQPTEVFSLMAEVNKTACDKLSFQEFCTLLKKHGEISDAAQRLRDLFQLYDPNGDGFITREQLKITMANLGNNMSDQEIDAIFYECDLNGDGKINYHEFAMTLALKHQ